MKLNSLNYETKLSEPGFLCQVKVITYNEMYMHGQLTKQTIAIQPFKYTGNICNCFDDLLSSLCCKIKCWTPNVPFYYR